MGGKSSHFYQADRPESGGADRNELREKSGLLDIEKQEFAAKEADERMKERAIPGEGRDALTDITEKRERDDENEER